MDFDPISQDPLIVDPDYPPTTHSIMISGGENRLLGVMLLAGGAGPHPNVILLHGIPGDERNFDLAQIIRRAGWNVMVFHYSGSWGSEGAYRLEQVLADTAAALAYLRQHAADHRADPARIVLAGHSLGGWAALMAAAADQAVMAVASVAGYNLGAAGEMAGEDASVRAAALPFFDHCATRLQGTTGTALIEEAISSAQTWDYTRHAAALADRPVLLVAGSLDVDAAPLFNHTPMVRALQKAGAAHLTEIMLEADHYLGAKRVALARLMVNWLAGLKS